MRRPIKVITFFRNGNLGSELQAFAMKDYLDDLGYTDICFVKRSFKSKLIKGIDYTRKKIENKFTALVNKEFKELDRNTKAYIKEHEKLSYKTSQKIISFSKDHLNYQNINVHKMKKDKETIYICGSDQIWSPLIMPLCCENFLKNVSPERKIAYAPSFGMDNIPKWFLRKVKKSVVNFKFIAMREVNAAKTVTKLRGIETDTVTDPVFLPDPKKWDDYADTVSIPYKKYVFCYFLDKPTDDVLKYIDNNRNNNNIVYICYKSYFEALDNTHFEDVDPFEFLALIKNSDMVYTDSFHATVFSIIFKKQFQSFGRNIPPMLGQGDRLTSLLQKLAIPKDLYYNSYQKPPIIDYKQILEKFNIEVEKSRIYLKNALTDIQENN